MLTETYRKESISSSREIATVDTTYVDLAKNLGFKSVFRYAEQFGKAENAALLFDELVGEELNVWVTFLPEKVSMDRYTYDQPPLEALKAIADACELGFFDSIEIWTPQGNDGVTRTAKQLDVAGKKVENFLNSLDPIAVGVITVDDRTHYYPIVRWGESLVSFKTARRQNRAIRAQVLSLLFLLPAVLVLLGLSTMSAWMQHYGTWPVLAIGLPVTLGTVALVSLFSWALKA